MDENRVPVNALRASCLPRNPTLAGFLEQVATTAAEVNSWARKVAAECEVSSLSLNSREAKMLIADPYRVLGVMLSTTTVGVAGGLAYWDELTKPVSWSDRSALMDPVSTSGLVAIFALGAMVFVGLSAHLAARNHAGLVNWTALSGLLPMLILAIAEPECNPHGSITTGFTTAAVFGGCSWVFAAIPKSGGHSGAYAPGISAINFVRYSAAIYLGIVVAFALLSWIKGDIHVDILATMLIFCGIGMGAAAALKGRWLRSQIIALTGMAISIIGAGIQMERAFSTHPTPFQSWHVLLVAWIVALALLLPLALRTWNGFIRNAGVIATAVLMGLFTWAMAIGLGFSVIDACGGSLVKASWVTVLTLGGLVGVVVAVAAHRIVNRI